MTAQGLREVVLGLELSVFRYFAFGLSPSDAEKYLRYEQPLAWALAALMRRGHRRPAPHKLACLKRISRSATDGARRYLLINCVETYVELAEADEKELKTMLAETENQDVLAERLTWGEKMELKGRQEGELKGELKGMRNAFLRLLEQKLGPLPTGTRSQIEAIESVDQLEALFDRVLTAESLEEIGLS